MPTINIDPKYRLGVDAQDAEHAQLIGIVDDLKDALAHAKRGENAFISTIVERLISYTRTHFEHEEQMMAESHYPGLEEHRHRHAELKQQVEKFSGELLNHRDKVVLQVNLFMNVWLYEHITKEDAAFARYYLGR